MFLSTSRWPMLLGEVGDLIDVLLAIVRLIDADVSQRSLSRKNLACVYAHFAEIYSHSIVAGGLQLMS